MMLTEQRCELTIVIGWFLGFTLVLCWSIYQLPDGGGQATWVPDAFRRRTCLAPLCPVIFAVPSIFWPITLCVLVARTLDTFCGVVLSHVRKVPMPEMLQKQETYSLLHNDDDEENCIGLQGGIPLHDLSDEAESPRSSSDESGSSSLFNETVFAGRSRSLFRGVSY